MPEDLDDLNEKLKAYRSAEHKDKTEDSANLAAAQNMNAGVRAGAELVVTIGAGTLIGYYLDSWLGTKPAFLIVFILAGIFAGFMNIYKITQNIGDSVGYAPLHKREKEGTNAPENVNDNEDA